MKKAYPKNVRHVHSEYLNNSFLSTILFLVFLSITAFALTGCFSNSKMNKESKANLPAAPKMKLSTGNRVTGPGIAGFSH